MNFGELRFWVLLFQGLALLFLGRVLLGLVFPRGTPDYDKAGLAVLGLTLLFAVSVETGLIFVTVLLTTFFGATYVVRRTANHWPWLWLLIPLQLGPLLYYKYAAFITSEILRTEFDVFRDLIIPVGISFYTFQMVSFVVDTLALKKPIPRFLDFLNFAGFFPQLVAGPIERREELLPQMQKFRFRYTMQGLNEAAGWIVLGLFFKCCLADNLANSYDPSSSTNPYLIWKANILFGLRIYYDFAGYSLIAYGLGKALGIQLTLNFLSPYCARSIGEFWRRWHVSLSQWFRDYVYVPLGGSRVRWWALNVGLVFVLSGIWHGAGWNFLIWGMLHAMFLVVQRVLPRMKLPALLGWGLTMGLVFFAWLAFYELRSAVLVQKIQVLCNPSAYTLAGFKEQIASIRDPNVFVALCFVLLSGGVLVGETLSISRKNEPYYYLRRPLTLAALVILTIWLAPGRTNDFIYFAF